MQPSPEPIRFHPYAKTHRQACLALFDANCPEFFASNEREDYAAFLKDSPAGYEVCVLDGAVVGAAGLVVNEAAGRAGINWILFDPAVQGRGLGTALMERLLGRAREVGVGGVELAASHKSAPFFARFGAVEVERIVDGWGPGMHRIEMEVCLSSSPEEA